MKKFKKVSIILLLCMLLSVIAMPVSASAARLNKTSISLNVGKTYTLKATGIKGKITWTSSKKSVATVSSKGFVKAKKKGTAVITAKYGNKKLTCKVIVKQPVTRIKLNKKTENVAVGKKIILKATVSPTTANNKTVTWKSSNTSVATVSSKGVVTGKKKGTVTITATAKDGSGKKAVCRINVKTAVSEKPQNSKITSISLDITELNIDKGMKYNFSAQTTPTSVAGKLQWKSSDPSVATISSTGELSALKNGSTIISASTMDGSNLKAQCVVSVNNIPDVRESIVNPNLDVVFMFMNYEYIENIEYTMFDICGWKNSIIMDMHDYKTSGAQKIQVCLSRDPDIFVIQTNDDFEKYITTDEEIKNAFIDVRDSGTDVIFVNCTKYNALSKTLEELSKKGYV